MPETIIPPDVRQFLTNNVDSVAQLEGLLLLRADEKQRHYLKTIADRLYIPHSEAEDLLNKLVERGLAAKDSSSGTYFYHAEPEVRLLVDRLADIYSRYLLPVTHFIHSKSKARIQKFADAFRIRKD